MKIKKLIVALTACLAIALCSLVFAACNKNTELDEAYSAYSASMTEAGLTPLSFEEWLESISKAPQVKPEKDEEAALKAVYAEYAGKAGEAALPYADWKAAVTAVAGTGNSVYINAAGEVVVAFTNGTERVVKMPVIRTVRAIDNNGFPVAGAFVSVYDYTGERAVASGVTDDNGEVTLSFVEEDTITYYAFASNADDLPDGVKRSAPSGYHFDNESTLLTAGEFVNGVGTVTYKHLPNHVLYNDHKMIDYKIIGLDDDGDIIRYLESGEEGDSTFTQSFSVSKGVYTYFDLDPKSDESPLSAEIAASGRYSVKFSVSTGNMIAMQYAYNDYYDDNGVPADYIAIQGDYATGTDRDKYDTDSDHFSFEFFEDSDKELYFYAYTSENATVTVEIKRYADARTIVEHPTPSRNEAHASECGMAANAMRFKSFAADNNGFSTAGYDFSIIMGNDGVYRIGSANGPRIIVNATEITPFAFDADTSAYYPGVSGKTLVEIGSELSDNIVTTEFANKIPDDGLDHYNYLYTQQVNYAAVLANLAHDSNQYHYLTEDILTALQAVNLLGTGLKHGNCAVGREWLLACGYDCSLVSSANFVVLPTAANESSGVYEDNTAHSLTFDKHTKITLPVGIGVTMTGASYSYTVTPSTEGTTTVIVKPDTYTVVFSTVNTRANAYEIRFAEAAKHEYMITENGEFKCEIGANREDPNGTETDYSDDIQVPEKVELDLSAGAYKIVIAPNLDLVVGEGDLNNLQIAYEAKYYSAPGATPVEITFRAVYGNDGSRRFESNQTITVSGSENDYIELLVRENYFLNGTHMPNIITVQKITG